MRVGADASYLRWMRTGIGRYTDGLLHALIPRLDGDQLYAYYNSGGGPALFDGAATERFIRLPTQTLWNQVRLPWALGADRCDVYLGTGNVVPLAPGPPSVVVVHDCLAFRLPWAKPGGQGRYWRRWTALSARRAAVVIAVSRATADDCSRYLGIPPGKVRVAWPGTDARSEDVTARDARAAADLLLATGHDGGPYVLQVGAYDPHKGGDIARRAVALLRESIAGVTLVQCGPFGPSSWPAQDGVIRLGTVPPGILNALYAEAAAVWVPSIYEGFGLPVLEAMARSRPVVASDAGGLREAGGDVALYAPPADPVALARVTAELLSDRDAAAARGALGPARAATFTWDRAAGQVLEALRDAARA